MDDSQCKFVIAKKHKTFYKEWEEEMLTNFGIWEKVENKMRW